MSLHRLALLAATTVIAFLALVTFFLASPAAIAQQQPRLAPTPFTFTKLFDGDGLTLEADPSTFTAMRDTDGDLVVAGVFRLIRQSQAPGEVAVFVMVTAAVCGYDKVVVLYSKDFTADGTVMGETTQRQVIPARPNTASGATYLALCGSGTKPSPVDRSYKAPERYIKFWT